MNNRPDPLISLGVLFLQLPLLIHRRHGDASMYLSDQLAYIAFYNARRPHVALDGRTPDQAYFDPLPLRTAA